MEYTRPYESTYNLEDQRGGRAKSATVTYAIVFEFDLQCLILKAERDTDTISVHVSPDVNEWLKQESSSGPLSLESCHFLTSLETKMLTNVWQCQSDDDYLDAIDLGFGDLNFPTVKVFCITSELHLLSITAV